MEWFGLLTGMVCPNTAFPWQALWTLHSLSISYTHSWPNLYLIEYWRKKEKLTKRFSIYKGYIIINKRCTVWSNNWTDWLDFPKQLNEFKTNFFNLYSWSHLMLQPDLTGKQLFLQGGYYILMCIIQKHTIIVNSKIEAAVLTLGRKQRVLKSSKPYWT